MKLVAYSIDGERKLGLVTLNGIVDLASGGFPNTLEAFLAMGPATWQRCISFQGQPGLSWIDPAGVRLRAPLSRPDKIIAIGLNYRDHAQEQGSKPPERPIIFAKYDTSILDPGGTITWDPALTNQVDYEAELGVIIGREARNVSEDRALDYVFGYTCVNDVSARDLQFSDKQWVRAKSLDTFCPMGPMVVTTDEIPDPQALAIRSRLNGQVMQDSNTREMIFPVKTLVSFLSRSFTLLPGDLIATGTPSGVGVFRKPPVFMKDGDTVEIEVEKIGVLKNTCKTVGK